VSHISNPKSALQEIARRLIDSADPDDEGFQVELGEALLNASEVLAKKVRQTNKACKGSVTLKFELKGYRTKNKEVAIDLETPEVASKLPSLGKRRSTTLYAGHDGELSDMPVQEAMPLYDRPKVIEGGKVENIEDKKGKKAI
jgi:hypothetical protein